MTVRYTVDISDLDWKVLAWKHVNPHQHIDDLVTNRAKIALEDIAKQEIDRRLNDPNWTSPIPADYEVLLQGVTIKTAKQMHDESDAYMQAMVADPDFANNNPIAPSIIPK